MGHCIEINDSMFSASRVKPWHYELTKDRCKIIQEAPNSKEALIAAGLDWTVEQTPVYMNDGTEIKNYKANVRSDDKTVLGFLSLTLLLVKRKMALSVMKLLVL